ncbi:GTPase IMAP family member 7-like [Trichomycterus rosablanca]|uniref:GTPase IMAP family member 7-like n=1 Tax=Trichomycterus rosablanca TaxID=2290929 RepID=UPI002F356D67
MAVNFPEMGADSGLRLVVLGLTGSGKTAARNTILGIQKRSQARTPTSTQHSKSTQGKVFGRQVTVVDTPDWFSPGLSLEELRQDVRLCVFLSAPGPHALLLVIPLKQSTEEDRGMQGKMEQIFGETCWKNTMILFTVTDEPQKKNIGEFIQSGNQEVKELLNKCGNRFHCLSIKEHGNRSQVSDLLKKIEKMVEENREGFYSSKIYLKTEFQNKAIQEKVCRPKEAKIMKEENETKEQLVKEVQDSLSKTEELIQEHEEDIRQLKDSTAELERKLKNENDPEKKRELERKLKQEVTNKMTKLEEKANRLKDKRKMEKSILALTAKMHKELSRQVQKNEVLLTENAQIIQMKEQALEEKETLFRKLMETQLQLKETMKEMEIMENVKLKLMDILDQKKPELMEINKKLQDQERQEDLLMSGISSGAGSSVYDLPELRLVLLGKTESGKTASGNTILGREERREAGTSTSTQQKKQDLQRKLDGVIQEHEKDIRQLNDRTTELERQMKKEKNKEKKRELKREFQVKVERKTAMEENKKRLKEEKEKELREMEERHQQEMEEIREMYEKES